MNLKSKNKVDTNKYQLEIEVSAEDFKNAVNEVYKTESKKMTIPGFRKGKAPKAFIEKYYGKEVFYEAAIDKLYRPMVMEAIDASELSVVSVGEFDLKEISAETGLSCTLNVVVKPEVKIDGYKGIELTKGAVAVTDGDIDTEIERVRERNSRLITVEERAAENGDTATIDFDGYVDDKQFDGGKAENHELVLGSGQFIPGFEEQIVGHNIGEEFDVLVKFPDDYHAEELKGKDATFKVKLHSLKKKELPELDDEFVKDVSEFDTLAEYKADIEKKLLSDREKAADTDVENQMIDTVIGKVEAEIPEEMIENEIDELINSFSYRLQSQGLNLETYLKYTGMTTDNLREQNKEQAERQVKVRLGLEKIAEIEGVKVTEEETAAEFEKLATSYNMPVENVKNLVSADALNADIANQKVIDFLRENAVISAEKKTAKKTETKKPAAKKPAAKKTTAKKTDEAAAPKKKTTKKVEKTEE